MRWWDQWLKGEDTGIMDEPMLRAWVQDSVRPKPTQVERPGRWVTADSWPPPFAAATEWSLNDGSLDESDRPSVERRILGRQVCGMDGGAWCGEGETADDADDQRAEDGMSMVFDSAPLEQPLSILGAPTVTLDLRPTAPPLRSWCACARCCRTAPRCW